LRFYKTKEFSRFSKCSADSVELQQKYGCSKLVFGLENSFFFLKIV